MKGLKNLKEMKGYSNQEIEKLSNVYNYLVTPDYWVGNIAMIGLIVQANVDQNLPNPFFEITREKTRTGDHVFFPLEWHKKYVVGIYTQARYFYTDENDDIFSCAKDCFIDDLSVAKKVYNENDCGKVELREYDGSGEWEHYTILNGKFTG